MEKDTKMEIPNKPNWCPGCGNYGVWNAFREAAAKNGWDNTNTAIVAGVGCHGHIVNFTPISGFEGLHGRPIPLASGVKMANHGLNVFVFTGDGDCLSEGGNHFVHASRRNQDITVILHDNAIYGLTTGQTSPRSPKGYVSKSTPSGNADEPIHPLRLAISSGATFAARAYAGDQDMLIELMEKANAHKGFAVIDVLQPCVTFNKVYTHEFYKNNIYKLDEKYDQKNREFALAKAYEWGEKKIPVGILFETDEKSCEESFTVLAEGPLVRQPLKSRDIGDLWKKYS